MIAYYLEELMTSLYLILLVAQSFALKHNYPASFGGKTDFSNSGWRALVGHLSPEVKLGLPPTAEFSIEKMRTCPKQRSKCSISHFQKHLALKQPKTAKLWVKWHQDAPPSACDSPGGCIINAVASTADLTSQSKEWSVRASIDAIAGINNEYLTVNGKGKTYLRLEHSKEPVAPTTKSSSKVMSSKCSEHHMCYVHTGTLMMTVYGICDSKPAIDCDRTYYPCEELNYPEANICFQWDMFTLRNCKRGISKSKKRCHINVVVTHDNGKPISFQVFEQKPMPGKRFLRKRDNVTAENPYGELPDGSSGAWLAWSPKAQQLP